MLGVIDISALAFSADYAHACEPTSGLWTCPPGVGVIWTGARLGSIGIGFTGGMGVAVLALVFGPEPGAIPVDVMLPCSGGTTRS